MATWTYKNELSASKLGAPTLDVISITIIGKVLYDTNFFYKSLIIKCFNLTEF